MRNAETVLGIIQERGKRGLPMDDLYRQLFNPDLYLRGYGRLAANKGATTKGVTPETVDGMSQHVIEQIIEALRYEQFRWTPARRVYIPKANGKQRPLGMPVWTDKLLQEVIRSLLEAYYEPQFSPRSHGFRPGRGCHTALIQIRKYWTGTKWFIEGDIKGCFDNIDHDVLLKILGEKIQDGRFLNLVKRLLQAGYLEEWRYHKTYSGTPQGGVVSPILANIYLDRLDKFVEQELIPAYTRGKHRRDPHYHVVQEKVRYLRRRGRKDEARVMAKYQRTLPSYMTHDPEYRRLWYVRYADDFVLGFIGPRSEAEEIKQRISSFLRDTLHLEMSAQKTLITHATTEAARFLGYDIINQQGNTKQTDKWRSANGRIALMMPSDVLRKKRQEYMTAGKPSHRAYLLQETDYGIVARYAQELMGFANYYGLASNRSKLWKLHSTMRYSLLATLAGKHKTTRRQIANRYTRIIETEEGPKKAITVTLDREGKPPLVARFGGYSYKRRADKPIVDTVPTSFQSHTTLEQRLLADQCELCGTTGKTNTIEVHHIRKLADLKVKGQREKPAWVKRMAASRRKTLVVCEKCHDDIHAGKPYRRYGKTAHPEQ
ncbi:MAG: reverse transcriptase domain-containing protein [Chloroflexota bacterium]|nr:reverse transcriptase domain-containing protein [Chloroflexota bacterium]